MDTITTIALIGAVVTATATGIAALPWRREEIDAARGAVDAVAQALGGVWARPGIGDREVVEPVAMRAR